MTDTSAPPLPARPERPDTGWPDGWFEQVGTCLYCGGEDLSPCVSGVQDWFFSAVPGAFALARCDNCSSLVLTRRPDPDHIALAYRSYYTHTPADSAPATANPAKQVARWLAPFYERARHGASSSVVDHALGSILHLAPHYCTDIDAKLRFLPARSATVLDYGCGNGDFLSRAAALGHRAKGVDFDADAVAAATARGLDIIQTHAIDEAEFCGAFDLVTASHVLEHVADPVDLLTCFARWLKPAGKVYIELPNAEAAGLAKYGPFWRGLEAPRHFGIPSLAGLERAFAKAGLRLEFQSAKSYAVRELWGHSQAARNAHPDLPAYRDEVRELGGTEVLICVAGKA